MGLLRFLPYAGWPLAAILAWLWLESREDLAAEKERCNADKLSAVVEAEKIARNAERRSAAEREAQLVEERNNERNARRIVEKTLREVEGRPEKVRIEYQRIRDENACVDAEYPSSLLECVRGGEDCGKTSIGRDSPD